LKSKLSIDNDIFGYQFYQWIMKIKLSIDNLDCNIVLWHFCLLPFRRHQIYLIWLFFRHSYFTYSRINTGSTPAF